MLQVSYNIESWKFSSYILLLLNLLEITEAGQLPLQSSWADNPQDCSPPKLSGPRVPGPACGQRRAVSQARRQGGEAIPTLPPMRTWAWSLASFSWFMIVSFICRSNKKAYKTSQEAPNTTSHSNPVVKQVCIIDSAATHPQQENAPAPPW